MNPTTQDEGATAQPNDAAGMQPGDMVISQDQSGTPTMVPADQPQVIEEAPETSEPSIETTPEEPAATPAQAPQTDTDQEVVDWAARKGITLNPDNETEIKLARVNLENDRRFHEASQQPKLTPPELLEPADDQTINAIVERQNKADLTNYVKDWFRANPDMNEYRSELKAISESRPYLQDLDEVAGMLSRDPGFAEKLRNEGGKKALQNLAQKQSNIPPAAAATNPGDFSSAKLTAQNIDQMVNKMSPEEYKKRLPEINAALAG